MNMRKRSYLCIVAVLLSLLTLTSFALDRPGWYESEGEHVLYGQVPSKSAESARLSALDSGEGGMALLGAPDEASPEIEELARNLQHDPRLIYEFVRNKIEYVPYYGFLKGATQTLLDRAGNDADQAALLAALLRASGFTASYNYGIQWLPTMGTNEQTAARWFDVEDSPPAVDRTIYRNGIPGIAYVDWTILDRIWIQATVSGQVYQLDAAFKPHTRATPLNFASSMSYNRAALLTAAGGEVGANYARNLSEANLAQWLCGLSSNLLVTFRNSYPNSEIEDILGKSEIIPEDVETLPTELPFYTEITDSWDEPPTNLIHTVRIQHGAIDESFSVAEIAGKRLSITYTNDSGYGTRSMLGAGPESMDISDSFKGVTASTTQIFLPTNQETSALSGSVEQAKPFEFNLPDTLVSGQVFEIQIPAPAPRDGKEGGNALLSTYPWDFGWVYTFMAVTGTVTYPNPNEATLHMHAWIENNGSGAFQGVSGIGYTDLSQGQSLTIRIRFNGSGQSYGTKTATLRVTGYYVPGYNYYDDTFNMSGIVKQEPRTDGWGANMGITWLNYPVTGTARFINNGNYSLYINWMSIVGANPSQFEFTSGNGSGWIGGGGGYRDIGVRYKATAHGSHSATVRINFTYDGLSYEWDYLPLAGQAVYEPNLSGSYGCNYGTNYYQHPADGTCRLRNGGSYTLTINSITLTGAGASQYQIISGGGSGSVGAGSWRDIGVRFLTTAHGTYNASVHVTYTYDGVSYTEDLPLLGTTVYEPNITGSYGINFGTNYYQEPVVATSLLQNAGSVTLTINSMSLVGSGSSQYEFTSGNGPGSIGAGSGRSIGVRHRNTERGVHEASIHVNFTYDGITYDEDLLPLNGTTASRPLAQLWLNDTLIADESTVISGAVERLVVSVDHPYAGYTNSYLDQSVEFRLTRGAAYAIISDFGQCSAGRLLDSRQRTLDRYRRNGCADSSREVLTETLNVLGQTWMRETTLSEDLMNRLGNVIRTYHHRFGVMAQEEGYYVDVKAQITATIARDGDTAKESANFRASGLLASALEHGILEQLQGTNKPGVSTVRLLQLANQGGQKIFHANSTNFASISPQLVNYTADELNSFSNRCALGQTLVLPENAQITLQEWRGKGYVAHGPGADGYSEVGMIIDGDYYGGYGAYRGNLNTTYAASTYKPAQYQQSYIQQTRVSDPVDIATGNLAYDRDDLSLGSGVPPMGISLKRFYNSGQVNLKSTLGFGWHHSFDIAAQVRSEGAAGLGLRSPADAAALLVASVVIGDVVANESNAKGWATVSLVSKWATDQLNDNAVSVQLGDKNLDFVRLPDGSYNPPPGATATLTKSNGLFHLEERFGVKLDFNANGKLATWKDADNNTMSLSYNAQTNLQTVSDCFGRSLTFTYSGGNLSQVSDSTGRWVEYWVNSASNLEYASDSEEQWTTYGYDSEHRLLWIEDALGQRTVSNLYSEVTGKVLSQRNGAGQLWDMLVVPQFRSAEVNPFGYATVYFFDDKTRQTAQVDALGNENRAVYDGQNHVVSQWDPRGNLTQHQFDGRQNRTNIIDALGRATTFSYDSQSRLVKVTDPLGHETRTGYDSEHHQTNTVDAASNVTSVAYFANGLPQTVTGPRGEVAAFAYDAYGNPSSVTRTDGGTETRTWSTRGDLLTLTDANTNTTTRTYDRRRLLTSERDPYGKAVSNVYNAAGLLVTIIDKRGYSTTRTYTPTYKEKSIQYPDGGTVSNFYDAADRLAAVRDPMGFITSNRYDRAGRVVAIVNPRGFTVSNSYDQAGNLIAVRNPAGNVQSNQFDALNRVVKVTDALGFSVSNQYNEVGWLTARVDQEGKRTEYEHDPLGRVTLERRRDLESVFEYDAAGNRVAFQNPKGSRTTFSFDKMQRRTSETNATLQVTRYVYDPVGNLRQKINAGGQTVSYFYNAVNLLTNRQSATENVSFSYDPNGNLTNTVDALGTTRQSFDAMNRLTKVIDPFGQVVSNAYNLAGWRTLIVYPDGKTEQFAYNGNGRPSNVVASAFGLGTTTYDYDSRDNLTAANLLGGVMASYGHDNLSRQTSYSVTKSGSNLLSRSCTRNGLGFKETESIQAGLEALDGPAAQAHQHNAADQITNVSQSNPSSTNVPSFDPCGNMTQIVLSVKGQTFKTINRFDPENRLLGVTRIRNSPQGDSVTTSVMQLEYDAQGLVLRITDNGTVRRLVRDRTDALARPLVETDAAGSVVRWFVWSNGRLLAQVGTNSVIRVAHCDELGRVLAFTDNNGALVDEFAFSPYGRLIAHSGTTATPLSWLGGFGVWDAGHGLYLTRHRAYDANLASWLAADPLGINGLIEKHSCPNLYAYAGGAPLVLVDPSGLYGFGFGPNLGGGAGQDYDPQCIPFNSSVNSITAGPGSVQRNYGIFDLVVDGTLVAGTAGTGAGVYSAAVTYGPTVVAAGASVIAAGQNAFYRVMATQPGNMLNELILYYPQSAPARATTAEIISTYAPVASQLASGLTPGPGGPFANRTEAGAWFTGWFVSGGPGDTINSLQGISQSGQQSGTPISTQGPHK